MTAPRAWSTTACWSAVPAPDITLAQHLLPGIAGTVGTCYGPFMSAEDSIKVTVYGRGSHGALPQDGIDPVVLAAMIIVRLQTIVSREVTPGDVAIVTVGSIQTSAGSNVIPDHAVLQLNVRGSSSRPASACSPAIQRIIRAKCPASGSPKTWTSRPSPASRSSITTPPPRNGWRQRSLRFRRPRLVLTGRPSARISASFPMPRVPRIPTGTSGAPTGRSTKRPKAGHLADLPANHSPEFLPPLQPTLRTGTEALVTAAMAWLAPQGGA